MALRPGYRHTEIGVIPDDWDLRELGRVATFLDGMRKPVKDADRARMRGEIPYYGASGIIDYVNDSLFDEDLILLGEDGENILSRRSRLAFRISGKAWVNNHAHVLKPNGDVSIGFLVEYLESLNYERFNTGTAQPKLNKQTCSGILVALPSTKAEQEVIAEALGDADALVESLERLLTKKHDINQGAMQNLLTGRTRLPGFSGEWEVKAFGEIALANKGEQLDSAESDTFGGFPHLNGGVAPSGYARKSNTQGETIAISEGGNSCGYVQFMTEPFWCGGHCYSVTPTQADNRFLFHALKGEQSSIMALRVGSGLPNVQKPALLAFRLRVPIDRHEQTAIATVLSDMDAEIAALHAQLTKARQVKKGMMQELLTGRTRLV